MLATASTNQGFSKRHPADCSTFHRESPSLFDQPLKRRTGGRGRHTCQRVTNHARLVRVEAPLARGA
jgi:hypothetical protein